jgi:hypothetical protein
LVEFAIAEAEHFGEHVEPAVEEAVEEQQPDVQVRDLHPPPPPQSPRLSSARIRIIYFK